MADPPLLGADPRRRARRPRPPRRRHPGRQPAATTKPSVRTVRPCAARVTASSTAKASAAPARTCSRQKPWSRPAASSASAAQAGAPAGVELDAGGRGVEEQPRGRARHRAGDLLARLDQLLPRSSAGLLVHTVIFVGAVRTAALRCPGASPQRVSRGERNGTRIQSEGDAGETGGCDRRRHGRPHPCPHDHHHRHRRFSHRRRGGRWIEDWRPEDPQFWESTGKKVARRNLFFSIFSEHIGFSIWSLWSVLVLFLPEPVFGIDPAGKFLLTTLPTALGAFVRLPYTFAVAKFGGRNWTIISAALLLVPTIATAIVLEPGVSFTTLLVVVLPGRRRRRQLRQLDGQHQRLLPGPAQGLGARPQRRRRQPRRPRRPAGRPARAGHRRGGAPAADPVRLHPVHRDRRRRRRPAHGQPDDGAQPAAGHARGDPRAAHLDHVVPLHRDVRLVHRLRVRLRPGAAEPVHRLLRDARWRPRR